MHVLISIHKTFITPKELTFPEVKFMLAALQEKNAEDYTVQLSV